VIAGVVASVPTSGPMNTWPSSTVPWLAWLRPPSLDVDAETMWEPDGVVPLGARSADAHELSRSLDSAKPVTFDLLPLAAKVSRMEDFLLYLLVSAGPGHSPRLQVTGHECGTWPPARSEERACWHFFTRAACCCAPSSAFSRPVKLQLHEVLRRSARALGRLAVARQVSGTDAGT
jgi:hypothetical protein